MGWNHHQCLCGSEKRAAFRITFPFLKANIFFTLFLRTQPSKLSVKLGLLSIKGRPVLPTAPDDTADDSDQQSNKASGQQFGVEKVVIHESYDANSHLNDIAILRLDSTVNYDLFPPGASSGSVRRICLPPTTLTSLQDTTAVVAGNNNPIISHFFLNVANTVPATL